MRIVTARSACGTIQRAIRRNPLPLVIVPTIRTMSESKSSNKMIFAPGATPSSQVAAQFEKHSLDESQLQPDPVAQFHAWFEHAQSKDGGDVYVPETATLSTASLPDGRVSARMVYLKELDARGFVVYSNWGTSRKARDIASNPHAALTFWWRELERQVRVEGKAARLTNEESQVYFDTRIRGSRIGAWASQQSSVLRDRAELDQQVKDVEEKFDGQDRVPVPDFWGGIRIIPETIEFWQGRESRLHDRFQYTKDESAPNGWRRERLSP